MVRNADIALTKAKQKGKNNHQFYTTIFNSESELLFKLEAELYNALNNQELIVHFQPQLDLKNQKISGFETLLRWHNAELGMISPTKFIPIAEETGLIIPIGDWVLQQACQQTKQWQDHGYNGMVVAVNVSAKQFQQPNFIDKVTQILNSTGLAPQYLELEITESLFINDVEKTEKIMTELTQLGIKFSLDDFGTGYSSLSYLKRLPFNTVKIDKSFVDDIETNSQDRALISAIITLGKGYNLKVIAERVETESQVSLLKRFECDYLQGYWLSPPVDGERYKQFLDKFNL